MLITPKLLLALSLAAAGSPDSTETGHQMRGASPRADELACEIAVDVEGTSPAPTPPPEPAHPSGCMNKCGMG